MTMQYNVLLMTPLARSKARKRALQVTACQRFSGNSCGGSVNNWHAGWVVFVDINEDRTINGSNEVIRVSDPVSCENMLS
mgnify:CR=1 FL=1